MKKFLSLVLAIVMVASLMVVFSSCSGGDDEEKLGLTEDLLPVGTLTKFTVPETFKIGVICLHGENSTYDNNFIKAIKDVQTLLGLKDDQVLIRTDVPESNACYDAAEELVAAGCNIIFADSFGHEEHMIESARKHADVQYCHATGTRAHTEGLANYHNAFASIYEGRYLAGIAAGAKLKDMINSGEITEAQAIIGYVGAHPYAEVVSGYTAFYLGAKSVCSSVTMKVRYTKTWYDQTLEQEAATSLITNDKCVLISQHADSLGAPTACESKRVPNVSYNGATYDGNENTFLISSAINWRPYFHYIIKCFVEGKAIATDWCGGISEGSVVLSGLNRDVASSDALTLINAAISEFKKGTLHVFDTSKDNFITVNGNKIDSYQADVDDYGDFVHETEVVSGGYFHESEMRSAPYFDIRIDGIEELNPN